MTDKKTGMPEMPGISSRYEEAAQIAAREAGFDVHHMGVAGVPPINLAPVEVRSFLDAVEGAARGIIRGAMAVLPR